MYFHGNIFVLATSDSEAVIIMCQKGLLKPLVHFYFFGKSIDKEKYWQYSNRECHDDHFGNMYFC